MHSEEEAIAEAKAPTRKDEGGVVMTTLWRSMQ
jgi:hypothetical protein